MHLIAEVPRVFPCAGYFFRMTYRFRDIGVQMSPLILGAPRKFVIFRLPLQRRLVSYRLRIWQIDRSKMEALYQNNFG